VASKFEWVSSIAAQNPRLFNTKRLEQQQLYMKEFTEEVELSGDAKLFVHKALDSKSIVLLPLNSRVYCKKIGQLPKSVPKMKLKPASIGADSKIDMLLTNNHWLEVYDPRSNSTGWILRTNVRVPQAKNVLAAPLAVKKNASVKNSINLSIDGLDSIYGTATKTKTQFSGILEFEPFKAKVLFEVPLLSGPSLSVPPLLTLPKGAEVFAICRRNSTTTWY